jgi:transposase
VRQEFPKINVSKATVNRIKNEIKPRRIRHQGGRSALIPTWTKEVVLFKVRKGYLLSANNVQKYLRTLGYSISYSGTTKVMRSLNLKSKDKTKKAFIKVDHQKERLRWAKQYRHWTVEDWKTVIFSDETKINRWGSDGRQITWKFKGDQDRPHNYQTRVQGGGGSIMIWGCMTSLGVSYACRIIEYPMNSELYTHILNTSFKDTLRYYGFNKKNVIFQQDGDTKHTSRITRKWLENNRIRYIEKWPACSPDLNPIEHLWHHLKLRLNVYATKPKNIEELWSRIDVE